MVTGSTVRIGWITDLHIGRSKGENIAADFEAYLDWATQAYDYIFITGDMIHDHGRDGNAKYHRRFQWLRELPEKYGIEKFRVVPGNHDIPAIEQSVGGHKCEFTESAWGMAFPEGCYSPIEFEHVRFVPGQMDIYYGMKQLTEGDLAFLRDVANTSRKGQATYLFTHIPILKDHDTTRKHQYLDWKIAQNILAKADGAVKLFAGHWHNVSVGHGHHIAPAFCVQGTAGDEGIIPRPSVAFTIDTKGSRVEIETRWGFPRLVR